MYKDAYSYHRLLNIYFWSYKYFYSETLHNLSFQIFAKSVTHTFITTYWGKSEVVITDWSTYSCCWVSGIQVSLIGGCTSNQVNWNEKCIIKYFVNFFKIYTLLIRNFESALVKEMKWLGYSKFLIFFRENQTKQRRGAQISYIPFITVFYYFIIKEALFSLKNVENNCL